MNPNCYPTAKLYRGELCMVDIFDNIRIFGYRIILLRTYEKDYSGDFLRFGQYTDPMCIESLDKECILGDIRTSATYSLCKRAHQLS